MDEARLEALLFPHAAPAVERRATPDFAHLHQELKRQGVTLQLLWDEYTTTHAGQAYRYSQFCLLYHRFAQSLKRSMRQVHRAGDKLFIDYSGDTVPVIDPGSGEIRRAEIFVAVLGASSYTYAEATWSQQLPDWIASHVRCFEFLGCVPALLVPDNLKSAIKRACRYEPEATSTYDDLARHYATAILPARPFHPRDKPAVEDRFARALRGISQQCRRMQQWPLREQHRRLCLTLRGLYGYFGISGNYRRLSDLVDQARASWRKWLSRRSNASRLTWDQFRSVLRHFPLPAPVPSDSSMPIRERTGTVKNRMHY
jgi:transposase